MSVGVGKSQGMDRSLTSADVTGGPTSSRPRFGKRWRVGAAAVLVTAVVAVASVSVFAGRVVDGGPFNHEQARTRTCVPLSHHTARLLYNTGQETGFAVNGNYPGTVCPKGHVEIDAHDRIGTGASALYFHTGGERAYLNAGVPQYGMYGYIRGSDLKFSGATIALNPAPGRNGTACGALGNPIAAPAPRLPLQLHYKTQVLSKFANYGDVSGNPNNPPNPLGQHYQYLTWNWVQDGHGNTVVGGGMVRTLVPRGQAFYLCGDVAPLVSRSYGLAADGKTWVRNGTVTVSYGAVRSGDGKLLYGWLVTSFSLWHR